MIGRRGAVWDADAPDATDARFAPRLLRSTPALDGLRGLAVLIVILHHSATLMPSIRQYTIHGGGLGVDAFFVLSGFLITALLLREQATTDRVRLGAFYRRRAMRLLPALIVLLLAQAAYASHFGLPRDAERESLLSVLFYYSNTQWHHLPITDGLGGLWSLAVEEQFYMVWPLFLVLFVGLRRRLSTVTLIMVGLIIAVVVNRARLFEQGEPILVLYTRTITRVDALLVGALLAHLWVRRRTPTRGLATAAWFALAFYAFAVIHRVTDRFLYLGGYTLVAIAVAVMILAVMESSWPAAAFLRLAPLRSVGRVSYGLYIWHLLIFRAVIRYGSEWRPSLRLVVALGLAALVTCASWFLVERPFLRWKQRLEDHDSSPSRRGRSSGRRRPAVVMP